MRAAGREKTYKKGNAGKLFTRGKVVPLIMYWSNSTWIWTLPASKRRNEIAKVPVIGKMFHDFPVIDSFFGEQRQESTCWAAGETKTNLIVVNNECLEEAGAVEYVTSLASLHESDYSSFVLHALSRTTRKQQQQSLLSEYERINLLLMINIYSSLSSFFTLIQCTLCSLASFIGE